jgi:hypothetical protein
MIRKPVSVVCALDEYVVLGILSSEDRVVLREAVLEDTLQAIVLGHLHALPGVRGYRGTGQSTGVGIVLEKHPLLFTLEAP